MRRAAAQREGRTVLETTIAIIVLGIVLSILMPVLSMAVESSLDTKCRGHLGVLFEAVEFYCQDYRGGKFMPASEVKGPLWFEKLEPLVAGHEAGRSKQKFTCPKAPPRQRGFGRDTVSFGWNELDVPWRTVKDQYPKPREKMLLGDSLGSTPGGARADTLVTREGELRLDARHASGGNVLFLDGHVEGLSRAAAGGRWPSLTLSPGRAADEVRNPLLSVTWWQWLLVAAGVAVPYALALGGVGYVRRLRGAREAKRRRREEEAERAARAAAEAEREQARRDFLRTVPSGPVEAVSLPRGVLRLGGRRFQVQATRELTIGRGEHAHVRVRNNPNVSREHAKIRPEARGYVLYDLYSRTGTFVAGERVRSRVLADGDRIGIGGDVTLTFELRGE